MTLLGPSLGIAGSAVTVPRFLYALFAVRFNALARTRNYELWQPTGIPPLDSLSGGGLAS